MTYVALLRGINVGGKNLLSMGDLASSFRATGCEKIGTYIQSGNVIFEWPGSNESELELLLSKTIQERFGLRVPVVLRTAPEMFSIVASNPFLRPEQGAIPEQTLHVYFLAAHPDPERAATLDPERSAPDRFILLGREIYLRLPNGMARTKLTNAYFDARLETVCTARNWRTVKKLCSLVAS